MKKYLSKVLLTIALPLTLVLVWELIALWLKNPSLLPTVEDVLFVLLHPFSDVLGTGSLVSNILISAFRVILGFILAVLIGAPLGLIMGAFALPRKLISPLVEFLRPLCPIAWIPFAMAVFKTYTVVNIWGIRYSNTILDNVQLGMLFIIFWGAFFPILLNTIDGVTGVKEIYVESAVTLGARGTQIFTKVILPAATPSIMTGLRVGLGISWMVIIAAEMLPGSDSGIGYLIMYAYEMAEMDVLITGMILIGAVGALLSRGVKFAADKLSGWQAKEG